MTGVDPEARFWSKVTKTDGCWLWEGSLSHNGYGIFNLTRGEEKRTWRSHRLAYTWLVAPIPEGMQLDHLCRTRRCVNPDHLEVVTEEENKLRGMSVCTLNALKTHCKHGHEFTPENTWYEGHWRRCRTCRSKKKT